MLTRFDRYLLSQFVIVFGFFSLILVSVYWVNRALVLFDKLISDGQTALSAGTWSKHSTGFTNRCATTRFQRSRGSFWKRPA